MGKIKLEEILNGNRSGSLDLTGYMLELFRNVLEEGIAQKTDSEELYKHLQNISKKSVFFCKPFHKIPRSIFWKVRFHIFRYFYYFLSWDKIHTGGG